MCKQQKKEIFFFIFLSTLDCESRERWITYDSNTLVLKLNSEIENVKLAVDDKTTS